YGMLPNMMGGQLADGGALAGGLPNAGLQTGSSMTNWTLPANCDLKDGDSPRSSSSGSGYMGDVTEPVKAIQDRAKLIRTVRKKIRYINFFLQRQGKGRELTPAERQRVKSLPFLDRELQLLEEQQSQEVERQKQLLGVDSLEFLRKPQQPMTYSSDQEKRFKTMRAIRKKIRFIHYHLERQRQ
ncbi:hypothetical protein DIPPA_12731, partial [Diplonema papillatum]